MFKKLISFFIPSHLRQDAEILRRYNLVVSIILITAAFDLNYAGITMLIGMQEGTFVMLVTFLLNIGLPFLLRRGLPILWVTNLYLLIGAQAIVQCIYFSGGFHSPVLPWLATTPIVAMLMGGRRTGIAWLVINTIIVIIFSLLEKSGYSFPLHYDQNWRNEFFTNCFAGLIMIIFFVALVFENGKNLALKKLAANNELLAEERKRTALFKMSQEIHDGVGQILSLAKLNLHALQMDGGNDPTRIDHTLSLISKAISDIRNISRDVNDHNINQFDLHEALYDDIDTLKKTGKYVIRFEITGKPDGLDVGTGPVIYRILQELMNNTIKHASATAITVYLQYCEQNLHVLFSDNGVGVENPDLSKGMGMRSIRNRIDLLGGEIQVTSEENKGMKVVIRVPLTVQNNLPLLTS